MADARPTIASASRAFGLPAAVTPPGGATFQTTVIWLPPVTVEHPSSASLQRAEARRVLSFPVTPDVTSVPRGTVVVVAEFKGQPDKSWKVDAAERVDPDHWRMIVVPA
jgi:hypothetical protein